MAVADVTNKSMAQLMSLEGRAAVVTGGARGIGLAIGRRLAEAGASVLVGDVDSKGAEDAGKELAVFGHKAAGAKLDMYDEDSVAGFGERALEELGGVDIWVNNAGVYPTVPFLEMSAAQWDQVLDLNLKGTFLGAREAAKRMLAGRRGGVIVNLASTTGFRAPGPGVAHYVSSKFGIRGLTKALAVELGPHNIRVLAVAPTITDTPGVRGGHQALDPGGSTDMMGQFAARLPLGRIAVADDVARVVLFCASDLASLMTGSTLAVDAGELAL